MAQQISEVIRGWLGWCPHAPLQRSMVRNLFPHQGLAGFPGIPENGTYVNNDVIVDYGRTAATFRFFIGIVIGTACIIVLLFLAVRTGIFTSARILFLLLVLSACMVIVLRDLKRARICITRDVLIIQRVLHHPVTIQKNTISAVELKENQPPLPVLFQKILYLCFIPFFSFGALILEYVKFISGESVPSAFFLQLGFILSVVVVSGAMYYHSSIRLVYPEILIISTTSGDRAGIYGENPREIMKMLEGGR